MKPSDVDHIIDEIARVVLVPIERSPIVKFEKNKTEYKADADEWTESTSEVKVPNLADENLQLLAVLHGIAHVLREPAVQGPHHRWFWVMAAKLYRYFGLEESFVLEQEGRLYPESRHWILQVYRDRRRDLWYTRGRASSRSEAA